MNTSTMRSDSADAASAVNEQHDRIRKAFGRVLKAARARSGLSQETLAQTAGIDRSYISMLERGKQCPTLAMLLRIASGLGSQPAGLLDDTLKQLHPEESA